VAIVSREVAPRVSVKTVWNRSRHNAGVHGSTLLSSFLGERDLFSFPKSLYAVRDTLDMLTHDNPDALILDFFAGSGTTQHATMLLNAQDGGRRRCILVTNNELNYQVAARLNRNGHFRGDPQYERAGVFEAVCQPRVMAAVTGLRPDGRPVEGTYLDGRDYSAGFAENVEFFELKYADPDDIDLGREDDALLPLLWLAAGAVGPREANRPPEFSMPEGARYAVLFDERAFRRFVAALAKRQDITNVWLITDSEARYAEMRSRLPTQMKTSMLYRDYLRTSRNARWKTS
jgi:adenine-specific DNA-methyltransferase